VTAARVRMADKVWSELWASLASLLRSYTAAHGLSGNRQATVELEEENIIVHHGAKWLRLERSNAFVTWTRDNGARGQFELTEHARIRSTTGEEELDLAAEAWARDLMQDNTAELKR
jgi:hypothetical protein